MHLSSGEPVFHTRHLFSLEFLFISAFPESRPHSSRYSGTRRNRCRTGCGADLRVVSPRQACDKSKDKDRKDYRQREVAPKVDAYFSWVKESLPKVPAGGSTCKALQYSLNQEEYLRFFLTDGKVPMDNNTAERAIRPFTLGRKNWVNVDSIRGAEASAIMYSLVETAKANGLRVYEYLEYLLTFSPGPKQPRKNAAA